MSRSLAERLYAPESAAPAPSYARKLGIIGLATYRLDQGIKHLSRQQFSYHPRSQDEIETALRPQLDDARETLDCVDPFTWEDTSWNDWYRLYARAAFAPKLVEAPAAFASYDIDRRKQAVYQAGDIATSIVAKALEQRDDDRTDKNSNNELRGVINEYTAISVVNYNEDGGRILLPSSLLDDRHRGIDSMYYWQDHNGYNYRTKTQVKSGHREVKHKQLSDQDVARFAFIYADDFANTASFDPDVGKVEEFSMSRALVEDTERVQTTDTASTSILLASQALSATIQRQYSSHNSLRI